ncbi:MAG: NAD+ synthase (glutamine-hydrolyzing) [Acidimicrobiales bacterium]|jgi:NAD+ synthase (glutamine-hydrolysing)
MSRLTVAACQINTVVGDIEGNVDRVLVALSEAEVAGADIAVFPELTVSGYPPEDLVLKPRFVADCEAAVARIATATGTCAALIGSVVAGGQGELFNTAYLCVEGAVVHEYHKRLLPNYAVFDEQRYFTPGTEDVALVDLHGVRVGVAICEDIWSQDGPLAELAAAGADIVLVPNGSPYRQGKVDERESLLRSRASESGCAIAYVNQVGGQDELVFDGGSTFVDATGALVARASQFVEEQLLCEFDFDAPTPVQHVSDRLDVLAEVWAALVLGTRDYVQKNGFDEVGVALSGGIDSSIVVALAVDALGADRVHAVLMPSRFSSDHSVSDSERLCQKLGVEYRTIAIEPAHASLLDMLAPSFADRDADTTEENLQSRIRGVVMMALSNKLGWLILTTGNKSEVGVGYSTLYGDTAGGFAVIKDVFKTMVYDLCRWRNSQGDGEVIPSHVIDKPPSAELRPDQRDDQSLPAYDVLDALLRDYVEEDLTASELIAAGHDEAVVQRIVRLVDLAEYKRRQSPPGVRISTKAFGRDRRVPITNRYRG